MRVLYVDDEAGLLEVGKLFLEKEGEFSVDIVQSASAALEMLKKNTFDAIISDYQMPDMDGIAFLKEVRSRSDNIPFILFTGRGREEVVIEAINNGADFYLQKGGDPTAQFAELAHKIRLAVQQRRAEISIRDHERREADIINFLPDATFAIDTHGVVIAWNRAMEAMTGVSAAEILGKGNYEYAIPFYHERRPILVDIVLKDDPATEAKYPYVTRSGDKLFSEITIPILNNRAESALWFTASPLYDTSGRVIGSIESIRDVTERKQAEEALRESEDRLISIFGAAQVGIILVDAATHRILQANAKALDLFGATEQDVVGRTCHTFICPAEEGRCPVTDLLEAVDSSERIILAKGGKKIPVLKTVVRRRIGGRDVLIESFVDITDRKRMEEALAESERRYRGVVETQTEFVCRFLPDGTHVFVNDAYCRYFGKTRNEIIGHRFRPEIPAEDQDAVRQHFASLTRDHPVAQTEHRIILPDGTLRWQWWNDHAIFDESGRVVEYQTTGKDITTRKQAEEALREREATLASIFRAAPTGIGMVINRVIVKVNDRLCGMTGFTAAELLGRSARVLYPSDEDYEHVGREKYEQIRKSGTGTVETRWQRKDGTIRNILLSSTPLDPSDPGKGVTFTALDITERKEAEEALRKSEEKFRYLVENALEPVLILNFEGKILFANKAVSKLAEVGDSPGLLNRNVMDFIAPESREDVIRDFTRVSQGHGALLAHYQVILANGKKITIECVGQLITYEGRPADLLSIRDITESRQHEEVVWQKNLMLSTLNDLQREFAELPAGMRVEELAVKKLSSLSGAIVTMFSTYDPVDQMLTVSSMEYATGILESLPGAMEMLTRWLGKRPEDMRMPLSHEIYRDINRSIVGIKKTVADMSYGCISPIVGASIQKLSGIDHFIHIAHVIDGELYGISVMGLKPGQADPSWELLESFAHIVAVSLRRQRAEAGLVESKELLRQIIEKNPMSIQIVDREGFTLQVNQAHTRLFGAVPPPDFSIFTDLVNKHPEFEECISRVKRGELVNLPDIQYNVHDTLPEYPDVPVWVRASIFPLHDKDGKPERFVFMHENITERKHAEELVRESENKFSIVFRSSPIALTLVSATDGTFVDVNDAFLRSTGYSRDEVIGRTSETLGIFADTTERDQLGAALRAKGTVHDREIRCRVKRGEFRTCLFSSSLLLIGGKPHVFSTIRDITEKRDREMAFQTLVRTMVGTTGIDALRKITENLISWLHADCAMIGEIQPDGQTVKLLSMLLDGKEVQDFSYTLKGTPCENVAEKGFCMYPDDAFRLFPGSRDLISLNIRGYIGTPLRNSEGRVFGILCVLSRSPLVPSPNIQEILDIIAVKAAAEIERKQSVAELGDFFNTMGDAIVIHDLQGRFLEVNDEICRRLGYSREELLVMSPRDIDEPEYGRQVRDRIGILQQTGHIVFETVHRGKDGIRIPTEVSSRVITYRGEPAIISTGRDITERKRAADALRHANKKLNLLSGITRHDLKNQLLTLNGFLEISKKYAGDAAKMSEFITREKKIAQTMEHQIAFTKEYEAIGVSAPVWQDCRILVEKAAKQVMTGSITVKNDMPAGSEVFADPLIVKVCYNLMDNAVRHGGKITTIRFFGEERDGDYIVVCEDDGVGIPAEEKEQIFERGFGKNTGMGLFLSAEILSITGITIHETGETGKGARFEITVPKGAWRISTP